MAQYRVLSGEGLYDVAAKLYKGDTAGGIQDLLSLNPTLDLNAVDLYGSTLTYTESLNRMKEVFEDIPVIGTIQSYSTREKQSIYDLSVQLYGDLSKIGNLLKLFPNLDTLIPVGSSVLLEEQIDPMALFFTDKKLVVATDVVDSGSGSIDNIILEDGDDILQEDLNFILIE